MDLKKDSYSLFAVWVPWEVDSETEMSVKNPWTQYLQKGGKEDRKAKLVFNASPMTASVDSTGNTGAKIFFRVGQCD